MIVYIDGPEKAGKTTFRNYLVDRGYRARHWGPIVSDLEYLEALKEDVARANEGEKIVWDRGWGAEAVYSYLLNRGRRFGNDPWLGEWLYGRAVQASGVKMMLLGPSVNTLLKLRDETDLPVNPVAERTAFAAHGSYFGYLVRENEHTSEYLDYLYASVQYFEKLVDERKKINAVVPNYCGDPEAKIVFVDTWTRGLRGKYRGSVPGAWLPFTHKRGTRIGRLYGPFSLTCGWVEADNCNPKILKSAKIVVTFGKHAAQWVKYNVNTTAAQINEHINASSEEVMEHVRAEIKNNSDY